VGAVYRDVADEYELVSRRVSELLQAGVRRDQIVVLGTHRLEHSSLLQRPELVGPTVGVFGEHMAGTQPAICYSTLHRFQGLEADVVLLFDVDGHAHTSTRRHVQVGASRAKNRGIKNCRHA
jgi:hypothetical protein